MQGVSQKKFQEKNWLHFPKEPSKSDPLLVQWSGVTLIRASKYHTLHTNAHNIVNSIASGVKQHLFGQSLHPSYHCILFGPPLLQSTILGPHKNHSPPSLVHQVVIIHRCWFSTLVDHVKPQYALT